MRPSGHIGLRDASAGVLMLGILTAGYMYVFPGSGYFILRLYGFYLIDLAVIAVLWVRHPLGLKLPGDRQGFAIYTAAGCIVVLGAVVAAWRAEHDPVSMDAVRFAVLAGGERAFYLLGMCLIGPALEEAFYRGMIYRLLRSWRGPLAAALGSTLVFALMHGLTAVAFVQGILLAWVYERSGSVWGPFAVHSVNNTAWFLLFVA